MRVPLLPILLILALSAAAGYEYWRLIFYPSTPQYAVEQFFDAANARQFGRMYELVKVTGPLKALIPGPEKGVAPTDPALREWYTGAAGCRACGKSRQIAP